MSSTLMSGTRKTISSGTTLTSLGWLRRGTTACRQQCPILALTLAPSLALPIAAVTIARRRSRGRGRPEDVIAKAKTPSPPPPSTDIVAAVAAIAAATVAAAAANATITTPSPFHPCLRCHYRCSLRQRHCTSDAPVDGWLLCRLSLLACCVICRPNLPAPPCRAVVDVDNDRYRCRRRLPLPLSQSTMTTDKSQRLSFVVNGGGG